MKYASVCDGIGAAHVAWQPLGWRCAWTSEISAFPAAVVEHRWKLPNLGDMTTIGKAQTDGYGPIDLLVGGTPCQSFSVAGLRGGLADPRGNLALVYLGLADLLRPRWVVWENVPGVLSSRSGEPESAPPNRVGVGHGERYVEETEYVQTDDFRCFTAALTELGYGWAYRVLDAQYIRVQSHPRAVPQRRRRVFVVGHLGDWRPAAQVLLERQGLCGHPAPGRAPGQGFAADAAPSLVSSGRGVERTVETRGQDPVVVARLQMSNQGSGGNVPFEAGDGPAWTMTTQGVSSGVAHTLRGEGADASEDGTGRGIPLVAQPYAVGNCLTAMIHKGINITCDEGQTPILAAGFKRGQAAAARSLGYEPGVCPTLTSAESGTQNPPALHDGLIVRRLTPRECERLQGFPDDYTLVPVGPKGRLAKDSPRYTALGNSMAVNVMSWIGQRIQTVDSQHHKGETNGTRTGTENVDEPDPKVPAR